VNPFCPEELHAGAYAATPEAGVLPNFGFWVNSCDSRIVSLLSVFCFWVQISFNAQNMSPLAGLGILLAFLLQICRAYGA
jgi:hypothetical protein